MGLEVRSGVMPRADTNPGVERLSDSSPMRFLLDILEAILLHPVDAWREFTTGGRCSSAEFAQLEVKRTAANLRRSWKSRPTK